MGIFDSFWIFSNVTFCAEAESGVKIIILCVLCPLKLHFQAIFFVDDFQKFPIKKIKMPQNIAALTPDSDYAQKIT